MTTKQGYVDQISKIQDLKGEYKVGKRGKSVPVGFFVDLAHSLYIDLSGCANRPKRAEKITKSLGQAWGDECKSSGDTVTNEGLKRIFVGLQKNHGMSYFLCTVKEQDLHDDSDDLYAYDSDVSNYDNIVVGDTIIIRGERIATGSAPPWYQVSAVATVSKIEPTPGLKEKKRCPNCDAPPSSFTERRTGATKYRCGQCDYEGNEFKTQEFQVTFYKAIYGDYKLLDPPKNITLVQIEEELVVSGRFNAQYSILPLRLNAARELLGDLLDNQSVPELLDDEAGDDEGSELPESENFTGDNVEPIPVVDLPLGYSMDGEESPTEFKRSNSPEGFIYVIANPSWPNWTKIGVSRNLSNRLMSYNTCVPHDEFKFKYYHFREHNKSTELEQKIHRDLRSDISIEHGHGEWYHISIDKAKNIVDKYISEM